MFINYKRTVDFSTVIINAGTNQDELITVAQKTSAGAPAATANKYIPGAIIQNTSTGLVYRNAGTTATPVWEDIQSGLTLPFADTDATSTTGSSFKITASALTTGSIFNGTISGTTLTTGGVFRADLGVETTGYGFSAVTTGVYTGAGLVQVTAAAATTGTLASFSGAGLTTGLGLLVTATAATLTTGRYASFNDGALEVFGIGANGHIHTAQTTAPTIAVTAQNGITAAAITAGSTDVCGTITTTGTNNNGGATTIVVTFDKTYTTAPKAVILQPLNTAAAKVAATSLQRPYVRTVSATSFEISIPADAGALATPSFSYLVVA